VLAVWLGIGVLAYLAGVQVAFVLPGVPAPVTPLWAAGYVAALASFGLGLAMALRPAPRNFQSSDRLVLGLRAAWAGALAAVAANVATLFGLGDAAIIRARLFLGLGTLLALLGSVLTVSAYRRAPLRRPTTPPARVAEPPTPRPNHLSDL
jgi:hypothetical protein